MSTILKELADHHNNIESIIKRAASTSSWKLGPQREKDCQCELLTISLYRKKCQHKLPLTHTHTIVVLTHRCTCNYSRWRPAGSRADTHDSTMNWNTQYSHQSKLLVLHEIKSNSQLSRHARKITSNAQANVSNQKHCIVHGSDMLVRKCLQMCQRSARMWRSKTQFYRYIILLTFSHTHVTLLCTQCIPVAVQYSCHYALLTDNYAHHMLGRSLQFSAQIYPRTACSNQHCYTAGSYQDIVAGWVVQWLEWRWVLKWSWQQVQAQQ